VAGDVDDTEAVGLAATAISGEAATAISGETAASSSSLPTQSDATRDLPEVADGRYTIGNEVGRGGLGRVLRARDEVLDRPVALKQLFASDDSSRRRFIREALITARLQHPAIIPVYDAGRHTDRSPFYAMKLVDGRPLDVAIARAPTLAARLALLPTVLAVADAVAYAHSQRIIHRDLKPGNVLVGEFGETIVIDWGLAKDLSIDDTDALDAGPYRASASTHTVAGAVLGTPGYMAPEQAAGRDVDERADVYALGAILYHVVSGKIPHEGTTLDEVIDKAIAAEVKPLDEREPEAPPDLVAIVGKAMAKDPAARYPSARELAEDLRRFQTGQLVGAHRYTVAERVRRWIRKHRAVSAVAAIAAVVLATFGTWSVRRIIVERDRAEHARDEALSSLNRSIITQAHAAMERDPAIALGWLRRLSPDGGDWSAARMIAANALSRPLPEVLLHGTREAFATPDGRYAVGYAGGGLWISELVVGAKPALVRVGTTYDDPRLEICDDSRHALLIPSGNDDLTIIVDIVTKHIDRRNHDDAALNDELVRCRAKYRLATKAERGRRPGLRWLDAKTGEDRLLGGFGWLGAWPADDAQHVVAIDDTGAFHRFDLVSGDEDILKDAFVVGTDDKSVTRAAMSRDGTVVVGLLGGAITYCDFAQKLCMPLQGKAEDGEHTVAVAPDGSWARVRVKERGGWFFNRDSPIPGSVDLPRGDLYATADSKWLLGLYEGKLVAQDVNSNVRRPVLGHDQVMVVESLPDGRLFTVGSEGTVRVTSLGKATTARGMRQNTATEFSPSTKWLITEGNADDLLRREIESGRTDMIEDYLLAERPMAAINDAGHVVRVARDGTVRRYENGTWREVGVHDGGHVASLYLLNSDRPVTIAASALAIWESSGPRYIKLPAEIRDYGASLFQIDRGERRAQIACGEHRCLVDLASGRVDTLAESVGRGSMSDDGRVMVTGGVNGEYLVWDLDAVRVVRRFPAVDAVYGLKGISRDGRRAVIKTEIGVDVIDLATGVRWPLRSDEPLDIDWVTFSPDSRSLLDNRMMLWDADSGEGRKLAPQGPVHTIDLLDDKIIMVTVGAIEVVPDDLPREPALLAAKLAALPYYLDDHDLLVVGKR